MTNIYIVTSGAYSEYHIEAVFDSQEKAQTFVDYENRSQEERIRFNRNAYDIEEWELNEYYDPISRGLTCFYVTFDNPHLGDAKIRMSEAAGDSDRGRLYPSLFETWVWAKDEAAALKIANEQRVQAVLAQEAAEAESQSN